ncbi:MAG: YabP/YqfC family sporulation protein [Flavonifractor plautii]
MPYEENRPRAEAAHHIILEEREQLSVSGVEEVESFDENTIVMLTNRGTLIVRGGAAHREAEPGRRGFEGGGHHRLPHLRGQRAGQGGRPVCPALPLK